MTPMVDLANRLRAAVAPYLEGDSRGFVDEWIDDVGEEGLAIGECLAVAAKHSVRLDDELLADARRLGWANEADRLRLSES